MTFDVLTIGSDWVLKLPVRKGVLTRLRAEKRFQCNALERSPSHGHRRLARSPRGSRRVWFHADQSRRRVPVLIDGKHATAWFNVRYPLSGEDGRFYEFGLYDRLDEKKRTQATQRLGESSPTPNTSQLGSRGTVGSFLEEIKDTLPAAIKVAADPTLADEEHRESRLAAVAARALASLLERNKLMHELKPSGEMLKRVK